MPINDPLLWEDQFDDSPPYQWQAVDEDQRYWFLDPEGNGGGSISYVGELDLPSIVTVEWEIVAASGYLDYPVLGWSSNDNPGGSVELGAGSGQVQIALPNPTHSLTISPTLYPALGIYTTVLALRMVEPPPPPACDEVGRATRAYVSGYERARVHQSRLYRFERRCLIANFNGAIPPMRRVVSATWRTDAPEIGVMSNPQISTDGRETMVMFQSQLGGWANLRVDATMDNGEIYTQVYRVNVREASFFFDDPPTQSGPFSLTVNA